MKLVPLPALEADGSRKAIYGCSKNSWINDDVFTYWLKHFAGFAKPSKNELILLILDNHCSHISLGAYEFYKTNYMVMFSLPPHGSHRIQPVDVSIYGLLKAAYKQEFNLFIKTQLGRKITYCVPVQKSFSKSGNYAQGQSRIFYCRNIPSSPDVFTDEDFWQMKF